MPVLRQHHTRDFTVIPNALLQDQRLSYRDVGLLVWMLSKPQDWKFSYDGMLAERPTDGKAALQKSIKVLQAARYLKIEKKRNKGRLGESIWYVYDSPYIENQYVVNPPRQQKTVIDSPRIDLPYTVNQPQQKKYRTKEKAAPAMEGGAQPSKELYRDPETGEWRRKENA